MSENRSALASAAREPAQAQAAADAVTAAAAARQAAQDDLERAIVAYRLTGASMQAIGDAAGFSASGILSVLRRHGVR